MVVGLPTGVGPGIRVALALPGESARVRVANATPVEAFAIPIDDRAG